MVSQDTCHKVKPLFLHYHSAYDHQAWSDIDFPWGSAMQKVIWRFDKVVLQGHATNLNNYPSTTKEPMITNFGRMVTYQISQMAKLAIEHSTNVRSPDNLKILYFRSHKVNGH